MDIVAGVKCDITGTQVSSKQEGPSSSGSVQQPKAPFSGLQQFRQPQLRPYFMPPYYPQPLGHYGGFAAPMGPPILSEGAESEWEIRARHLR